MYDNIMMAHLVPGANVEDPPKFHPLVVTALSVDEYQQMQMYLHAMWDGVWGTGMSWHKFMTLCAKAEEAYRYAGVPFVPAVEYTDAEELEKVMGLIKREDFTPVFRDCLRTDIAGLKLYERLAYLHAVKADTPVKKREKRENVSKEELTDKKREQNRSSQERFRQKQRLEEYGEGAGTAEGLRAWEEYSRIYRAAQAELKAVRARVYADIRAAKIKYVQIVTAENNRLQNLDK